MPTQIFDLFSQVRIINLVDRWDRRREMQAQLERLGGVGSNVRFFDAHRPDHAGDFPSVGARGCFESQLNVLRDALATGVDSVLIIEDDFDFTQSGRRRAARLLAPLRELDWHIFYGAHLLDSSKRTGLGVIPCDEPVLTASFIAFRGSILSNLVNFLEGILTRPAGSPEYGPMHVDGAYTVFRALHPQYRTFAAFPSLGKQRRSRSDITPTGMFLDRWTATRKVASLLRRSMNRLEQW